MKVTVGFFDNLTKEQMEAFSTLHNQKIRSLGYNFDTKEIFAETTVELSDGEKQDLLARISALPDTKQEKETKMTRLEVIKQKKTPTFEEVVEALKIQGIL